MPQEQSKKVDASNLTIDVSELKKKKLFVATPMYGGNCTGLYTKSISDLSLISGQIGLEIKFHFLFNESLIQRARNYMVDEFLRSDCTHMMFIDADIGFNYKDVLTLLHLCDISNSYSVITGPYPKKVISWEKIKMAVDAGHADKNPFALEQFVGDFVFNPDEEIKSFKISEPLKVKEAGTGFMMIHRSVFQSYEESYPELKYKPDHVRSENFDGEREIMAYFDCHIDPVSKRYLSEDYMFCQFCRKIGIDIWTCPWMKLQHVGSYIFGGNVGALASIDAPLTATKESNQKNHKENK